MRKKPEARSRTRWTRSALLVVLCGMMVALPAGSMTLQMPAHGPVTGEDDLQLVPEAADGFQISGLAGSPFPTAITFGPGANLYAAVASGQVLEYELVWTQGGPVVQDVSVEATGFGLPLGLAFDDAGNLYVSDSHGHPNSDVNHTMGRVWKIDANTGQQAVVVDGLPNGQHNTNHLRFGPDGLLYMPNGNPNDHGNGTGTGQFDVFPYSGAFLAVDVTGADADLPDTTPSNPAILHWEDGSGQEIEPGDVADHSLNQDFAEQVHVLAYGFRNIFGIAFAPSDLPFAGAPYTGMNGADDPSSQDSVHKIEAGENHGYPFCYNAGDEGAVGDDIAKIQNPNTPNPDVTCADKPTATAMLGWHVCATGVDFPTDAEPGRPDAAFPAGMQQSLFVGECGVFFAQDTAEKTAQDGVSTHNTGHKVARVPLDDTGEATEVEDFVTGLALPTDVHFGPDGAMYIADLSTIYRVAPTPDAPVDPAVPVAAVGQSFLPHALVVPTDVPITWVGGPLAHTVTTTGDLCRPHLYTGSSCDGDDPGNDDGDPNTFHHSLDGTGDTVTETFTQTGVYPYNCQLHYGVGMIGVVLAVDTVPTVDELPPWMQRGLEDLPRELWPVAPSGSGGAVVQAL